MSFKYGWNKAADFWNKNTQSHRIESSQGGTAREVWNQGSKYLTKVAASNKLDKPGGDIKKQGTDVVRMWTEKAEIAVFGARDKGGGSGTGDTVNEADTRATMAGRKNKFDEYSSANRRGVNVAMVNPNKGKKHSILTQPKKGGR